MQINTWVSALDFPFNPLNHDESRVPRADAWRLTPFLPCYYGTAHTSVVSNYEMTFSWETQWDATGDPRETHGETGPTSLQAVA